MALRSLFLLLLVALIDARTFATPNGRVEHVAASRRQLDQRRSPRERSEREHLSNRPNGEEEVVSHYSDHENADLVGAIAAGACSCM